MRPVEATRRERPTLVQHLASLDRALSEQTPGAGPNLHQYVSRHGTAFASTPLTPEEAKYARLIDLRRCPPRQCYRNAQVNALNLPQADGIILRYAEGFFSMGWGLGIEHAWLTINGKILDPTIRDPQGRPVSGLIPDSHEYVGVELHPALCLHILKHGRHISLLDDYECHRPLLQKPPQFHGKEYPDARPG